MSADNWMHCPRCLQKHQEDRDREIRGGKAQYGVVSPDEYANAMEKAEAIPEFPNDETFRENYEIDMESDGTFTIRYRGFCTTCGYEHRFKHTEDVPI